MQSFYPETGRSVFHRIGRYGNKLLLLAVSIISVNSLQADAGSADNSKAVDQSKVVDKVAVADNGKFQKPAWLKEFSIGLTQGYNSNVYLIDEYASADGFVPGDHGSAFTAFNPRVAVSLVPLLGLAKEDTTVSALDFYYDTTVTEYWDASSESNTRHKFGASLGGKIDSFSYGITNEFIFVDGRDIGDKYANAGLTNAYAFGLTRENKEQFQNRLNVKLKQEFGNFFVRPVGSLLYYDLRTKFEPGGYANYPDRYDVNGGLDLGYNINKDVAVFAGYRYGHQFQGVNTNTTVFQRAYTNDYHRVLAGVEGQPWKWLKLNLAGGVDFHDYDNAKVNGAGTDYDTSKTTYYFTGGFTVDITSKDSLVFAANHFQWVSSTGVTSYFDRVTSLTYKRKFTDAFTASVGVRAWESDYDDPGFRDDIIYGVVAGLGYKFDEHWSASLDYAYSRGDNQWDAAADREYDNHTISVGVKWKL
jgi:hypothetical protein